MLKINLKPIKNLRTQRALIRAIHNLEKSHLYAEADLLTDLLKDIEDATALNEENKKIMIELLGYSK